MSVISSLVAVRFYGPNDPYFYTIDNRPLIDLDTNVRAMATAMDNGTAFTITVGGTSIGSGTDTRILFQDGTLFGQDAGLTFNKTTDTLTIGTALALSHSTNAILNATSGNILLQIGGVTKGTLSSTAGAGLTLASGTATTDVNAVSLTQTMNAAGVSFTGIKAIFTEGGSGTAAATKLLDLQYGTTGVETSKFAVTKTGDVLLGSSNSISVPAAQTLSFGIVGTGDIWRINSSGHFVAVTDNTYDIGESGANRPRDIFVGRNLTITGDLTVNGSTVSVNADSLAVEDPLIKLAIDNSVDTLDIGFYGRYRPSATDLYAGLFRDASDGKFRLFNSLEVEPTTTVNTGGTGYAVSTLVTNVESPALTNGRVLIAGTNGLIEDDAELLYNKTTNALSTGSITASSLTSGRLPLVSTSGLIIDSAVFTYTSPGSTGDITLAGSASTEMLVHISNTGTGASTLRLTTADASADTLINFRPGATADWAVGVDNSATDAFVIASAATIGTSSDRFKIATNGSVILNATGAALNTNATDGFTYVGSCAGTPSGTPTSITGTAPVVIDSTNNRIYFYSNSAWRDPSSGATVVLNNIQAATGSGSLNNGDHAQVWNWALTTASKSAFKYSENSASTNGVGSQYLFDIETLAASTAAPFRVRTRASIDNILVSRTGDITLTGTGGTAGGGTTGSAINITAGQGAATSSGGTVTITGGAGGGTSGGAGGVVIQGGTPTSGFGGEISIAGTNAVLGNNAGGAVIITSGNATGSGTGGNVDIRAGTSPGGTKGSIILQTAASLERGRIDGAGNFIWTTAALGTSATDGFIYIPSCAGTPAGTPTSYSGRMPIVYDSTNNKFYLYNSGWKQINPAGRQTLWIPASAIIPRSTNGCSTVATVSAGAGQPDLVTLDFDPATQEYAQFSIAMPKSWDEGTVKAQFVWKHDATTTNFGVVWGLQAVSLSNDDAAAAAYGTAQEVTDTGGTTNDIYISDETAAITIAGSPAEGDWVSYQVYRNPGAGGDTMAIDAGLLGVKLFINTNAVTDD